MKLKTNLLFFGLWLAGTTLYSQPIQPLEKFSSGRSLTFLDMGNERLEFEDPTSSMRAVLDLPDVFSAEVLHEFSSGENRILRLQQLYQGIPVMYAHAVLHLSEGQVEKVVSKWITEDPGISTDPVLSREEALAQAARFLENEQPVYPADRGSIEAPEAGLALFPGSTSSELRNIRLVWQIRMFTKEPFGKYELLLDAEKGNLLHKQSLVYSCGSPGHSHREGDDRCDTPRLLDCDAPAQGVTAYYGFKKFTTNLPAPGSDHILYDCVKNFRTLNLNGSTEFNNAIDFTDEDNYWDDYPPNPDLDRYALDAHWCTDKTKQYFLNQFSQDIFFGQEFTSYLNPGSGLMPNNGQNNAFYFSGSDLAVYGTGSAENGPLTVLDIVGHEITHGLTYYTSNLTYANESGAINESISDIFGLMVQASYDELNWTMGEDVLLTRSFSDPNAYDDPDTYKGLHWYEGDNQSVLVHTNSGVMNHWFYLLSVGGSGTNDKGDYFDVAAIGISNAASLVYKLNTEYFSPGTDFHEARFLSMEAAGELFGYCSPLYESVMHAWYAVGVGAPFTFYDPIDTLWEDNITSCNATLHWPDVGVNLYGVRIRQAGSLEWTYLENIYINQVTVTSLASTTTYEWEVTPYCGDMALGNDVTGTFTTADACPEVTGITFSEITPCSFLVSWDENEGTGFKVSYKIAGPGNSPMNVETSTNQIVLSGLEPGTVYEIRIGTLCGDNCLSAPSPTFQVETAGCQIPENIQLQLTPCQATLSWDPIPGQSYSVRYKEPFLGFWLEYDAYELNAFSIPHFYAAGTELEFQLKITCPGDGCEVTAYSESVFGIVPAEQPGCEEPYNFSNEVLPHEMGYQVLVNWSGPANFSGFNYRWKFLSSTTWINGYTTNPVFTFYSSNTIECIEVEVQALCNCGAPFETSDWAYYLFCPPCDPPTDIVPDNICSSLASFDFTPSAGGFEYDVRYREVGDPNWTDLFYNPVYWIPSFTIEPLEPATTYELQMRSLCGGGNESDYTSSHEFTTAGPCATPGSLQYQTISAEVALISWPPIPGNVEYYEVEYRESNSPDWTQLISFNPYIQIGGLDLENKHYYVRVRAKCTYCDTGNWSAQLYFPECIEGLHLAIQQSETTFCDPCVQDCSLCIYDGSGIPIFQTGGIYKIYWTDLPPSYPIPASQLSDQPCIPIGPDVGNGSFFALVERYENIGGMLVFICSQTISYEHNCGEELKGGALRKTSSSEQHQQQAEIFPNPANSQLTLIHHYDETASASMVDLNGKVLSSRHNLLPHQAERIDISELPSGIYFVRIIEEAGNDIQVMKVIVSR